MKTTVVDVSDVKFSRDTEEALMAPSLGSCVAVSAYDAHNRAGGLMIFMLPNAEEMAFTASDEHPFMFADTAIPHFLQAAESYGLEATALTVSVVGGGQMLGQTGRSNVGGRNYTMARQLLARVGITPTHEDVGGRHNRTLRLRIADGGIEVKVAGQSPER
ncbi:MAG: chemotaxis protein CheD [Desulfosarcinaceae bacterium]|nr:chemotaxis protein CheD [Desulfosarcinaceae bacterium]